MKKKLLQVDNLKTYFNTDEGLIKAVDDVSFKVYKGETLGVVGESGCGKSVTSRSIIKLLPRPVGKIMGGNIFYHQKNKKVDITKLEPHGKEIRSIRGNEIAMIFQEPMTSLNPVYTVGEQITEALKLHKDINNHKAREEAINILERVGISAPRQRIDEYPHQLSGGMRQRVMIAIALSCNPKLLIADEPTTALDVTIEAQILKLMQRLKENSNMSIIFITHDLGVIREMADRIIVMYTGKIFEKASKAEIFNNPCHPYTKGLINSIPKIGNKKRLVPIKGSVPNLTELPNGCYFAPRCPEAMDKCFKNEPGTYQVGEKHMVKCWLYAGKDGC